MSPRNPDPIDLFMVAIMLSGVLLLCLRGVVFFADWILK